MEAPKWAQNLVLKVAKDEGYNQQWWKFWQQKIPPLTWRRSYKNASSGHNKYGGRGIVVTAGRNRKDQKLVLLHELAHWLLPDREKHSPKFYDKVWELYRRYGVPIRYAKEREGQYRKGATAAYYRNRKG